MTERDQKIIEQLEKCGHIEKAIKNAKSEISDAETEVERIDREKPRKKELEEYEDTTTPKKKILLFAIIGIVSALLVGLFFVLYNNKIESTKGAQEITAGHGSGGTGDPGEEYEKWLSSWSNYTSFEELETGWQDVQNDWKTKGIDITWEYVKNVWDNLTVQESNRFNNSLLSSIHNDYVKEVRERAKPFLVLAIIFAISFIIALFKMPSNIFRYANDKSINSSRKKRNDIADSYNNGEYLKLLAKWEENCCKSQKELSKLKEENNRRISELESQLDVEENKLYQTFNLERCHYSYLEVAWEMKNNFVSYERALQKCKEAEEEAHRRHEEALRRIEQERHNDKMERYAREQAQATREQAQAAKEQIELMNKAMKEQKIASKAKCRSCANLGRCSIGMRTNSTSCGAFIPK